MKSSISIKREMVFALLLFTSFFISGCESEILFPSGKLKPPDNTQVYAESYLSKTQTFAGEKVRFNLTLWYPENVQPKISDFVDSSGVFEVMDSGEYIVSSSTGIKKRTKWYDLKTTAEGIYIVPGFEISYREEGQIKLINTSSIYVEVFNEQKNYTALGGIRDLKAPYKPEKNRNLILFFLIPILIIISLIISFFYFRKPEEEDEEEVTFPHEIALERYYAIKRDADEKRLYPKEFCFRLSLILKDYIQERWEMEPLQMTSSEIIARLGKVRDMEDKNIKDAEKLLSSIELIKFTSVNFQEEWFGKIEEEFLSFLKNTKELKLENVIVSTQI